MQQRRVQSAENTKHIFLTKDNQIFFKYKTNDVKELTSLSTTNHPTSELLNVIQQENNDCKYESNNDNISSFEESKRCTQKTTNYQIRPRAQSSNQNNSLDAISKTKLNLNSPSSTSQQKAKIIMKGKLRAFPNDFFKQSNGNASNIFGSGDLSYQLGYINQERKSKESYCFMNEKCGSQNQEKLNSILDEIHLKSFKKQVYKPRNMIQHSAQIDFNCHRGAKIQNNKHTLKNKSQSIVSRKLNSTSTSSSSSEKVDQIQNILNEQKDLQQNLKILTPKFNMFEEIHNKFNLAQNSQINERDNKSSENVQDLNLKSDSPKQINKDQTLNLNTDQNLHVKSEQNPQEACQNYSSNEFLQSFDLNTNQQDFGTIQASSQNKNLKSPKSALQIKQNNNHDQQTEQINYFSIENKNISSQLDIHSQTAYFQNIFQQNQLSKQDKINEQQDSCFQEREELIQLKQKNYLQKFISQEDKIPIVFRQMLVPKITRPNSHNNQQLQIRDNCNIMYKLKETFGNYKIISLKELDLMYDFEQKNKNNISNSIQTNKKIIKQFPIINVGNTMNNDNNTQNFKSNIYQMNQDPLYNKIYNNNYANYQPIQGYKKRSYSQQKHERKLQDNQQSLDNIQNQLSQIGQQELCLNYKKQQVRNNVFEFSFSNMPNKFNSINKQQIKQYPHRQQLKPDTLCIQNITMDNTFNSSQNNQQKQSENEQQQQQDIKTDMLSFDNNNKENIFSDNNQQQQINSNVNIKKNHFISKRLIFDAKTICFQQYLDDIKINQSKYNILNQQQSIKNVDK